MLDNRGCLYYNDSICKVDYHLSFYGKKYIVKGRCFMTAFKKPLCGILSILLVFVFVAAAPITVFAEDEETTTISAAEIELNKETGEDYEFIRIENGCR